MLLGLRPDWQIPGGHFCPATPSSGERTLHLYYSLLNLQKEAEKRTFYLGKYRRPVDKNGNEGQTPHLLDLIGMSRDEADILYPFAKAAMADVFDALNHSTVGLPKEYRWEDKKNVLTIQRRLHKTGLSAPTLTAVYKPGNKVYITGTVSISATNVQSGEIIAATLTGDKARPNLNVALSYTTKRQVIATGEWDTVQHTDTFVIDKSGIFPFSLVSSDYKGAVSFMHCLELRPQDGVYTREELDTSVNPAATCTIADDWEFTNPVSVIKGAHFKVSNAVATDAEYEADKDFTENDLFYTATGGTATDDGIYYLATRIENDNTMEEGIHYFISFPNYLNDTLIEPLDTAIIEALVNRIIWKWLLLAFPNEAAVYDTLYQQSIEALKTRCDIFQKHWVNRTPRVY